jgi:chemotaxis protein MotB
MMRTVKLTLIIVGIICVVVLAGCTELQDLRIQNQRQRERISELDSQLQSTKLGSEQLQRKLDGIDAVHKADTDAFRQKIVALEEDINGKKSLISTMQGRLVYGGALIPVELGSALEDFAKADPMVEYDSSRGVVKFKSDLLFEKGSDVVSPGAEGAVKLLCAILNTDVGRKFDIIIAGHTDDIRIGRAETRQKHPTNWHLSVHRAISVLELMERNGIDSERMSARGFGEYRPIVPNEPGKKGNPQNRRVEIYIVPKGM